MGKVVFSMTVSLDGFVVGPNDEVDRLLRWYFSGDTPLLEGESLRREVNALREAVAGATTTTTGPGGTTATTEPRSTTSTSRA